MVDIHKHKQILVIDDIPNCVHPSFKNILNYQNS